VSIATPIVWFVFTLYYTGREGWLRRETWAALGGTLVVLVALFVTDPIHGLLTADLALATDPFPYLVRTLAPASAVYYVVLYAFVLVGLLFLFQLFLTSRRASRGQVVAIIVASLVSLGVNAVSEIRLVGVPGFDYSPIGAGLFAVVTGWGLFRHQLFSVGPLARTRLFEELEDAVVVVDEDRRIVDYNRTAESFHPSVDGAIGDRLDDVLPELVGSVGGADGELEFDLGERETARDVAAAVSLSDGTVTVSLTCDGSGVADATVSANGDRVGVTGDDGSLSFDIDDSTEELEVTVVKGEFETEFEYVVGNGTLTPEDSAESNSDDETDEESGADPDDEEETETETADESDDGDTENGEADEEETPEPTETEDEDSGRRASDDLSLPARGSEQEGPDDHHDDGHEGDEDLQGRRGDGGDGQHPDECDPGEDADDAAGNLLFLRQLAVE
jgi:hypothetical protein